MYNETLVKKTRLRTVMHSAEFLRKYFSDDSAQNRVDSVDTLHYYPEHSQSELLCSLNPK
jgi:hypothetical protein